MALFTCQRGRQETETTKLGSCNRDIVKDTYKNFQGHLFLVYTCATEKKNINLRIGRNELIKNQNDIKSKPNWNLIGSKEKMDQSCPNSDFNLLGVLFYLLVKTGPSWRGLHALWAERDVWGGEVWFQILRQLNEIPTDVHSNHNIANGCLNLIRFSQEQNHHHTYPLISPRKLPIK